MKNTKFHSFLLAGMMLAAGFFGGCSEEESATREMQMIVINYEDTTAIEDGLQRATRSQSASTRTESGILVSKSGEKLRLSCTEAPMPPKTVGVTRGAKVTTAGISSLGVSAAVYPAAGSYTSVGCGSYFYKEEVVSGSPTKYFWPGSDYKLAFYAYYPYGSTAFTVQSAASALGVPTYAYTVPSSPASQSDIMTGQDVSVPGNSETPANITLKHRCSSINFKVKNERSEAITVNSISIVGVKYAGTLNGSTWTLGSSVNSTTVNPFTLTSNAAVAAGETVSITGTDNIFMMLPQTLSSTAKLKVVIDDEEYETALTGTWDAGKGYTYTISMTQTGVNYLKFKAEEAGTFTLTIPKSVNASMLSSVSFSLNGGDTWVTTANRSSVVTITTPTVAAGDSVLWKGTGIRYTSNASVDNYSNFSSTSRFKVSGNIMSLLYGDDYENIFIFPNASSYTFCYLFYKNTKLTSIEELEFPATTLANNCYHGMFNGCTSLTAAPELPATTLANNCYYAMFSGCTSLAAAPDILLATTLAQSCYQYMFNGCSSLTTAPELPATTLANNCYQQMFKGCNKLNYIKAAFTTTPGSTYTKDWVNGVSSTGTFIKNSAATWNVTGSDGVPSGWTLETYTP